MVNYFPKITTYSILVLSFVFEPKTILSNDLAPWVGNTLKGHICTGGSQGYGPYDYTQRHLLTDNLRLVEMAHFNSNVERLIGGARYKDNTLGDLDYTLRAFPNHHRALNTAIRFYMKNGIETQSSELSAAECYLQRAINFSPKDGVTHMLYGILLHRTEHFDKALEEYETAEILEPQNDVLKYNLALLLTDLQKFNRARGYAVDLYNKEFPLQGLKNKLIRAGQWKPTTNIKDNSANTR